MAKPTDIAYEGTKIVLPVVAGKPMTYDKAIEALERKRDEEQQVVNIYHEIECSPLDGAVAFQRAMVQLFGWTEAVTGFFGPETTLLGVPVGPNGETEQVPYGSFRVPGIDGEIAVSMSPKPTPRFIVGGTIRKKNEAQIAEVVALAKKLLAEKSIYRGQAVRVSFGWEREDVKYHPVNHAPRFMQVDPAAEQNLVFGDRVARELEIGLFTPIEQQAACRRYQIPLKRGVLLYGPYGTGKTLTANVTAIKAARHGWTFVYLDDVRDLKRGLEFAARYAPAVLFAEDIDRMVTGERSPEMDEILNTLDGVNTKNGEIITVLTTNHVERINPAMLRMGRLDALVEVLPPDAKAAARLITLYARGLLEEGATLDRISARVAGKIPAFIREVTERAKLAAIGRLQGAPIEGHVTEQDLLDAAGAMETHDAFLRPKLEHARGLPEVLVRVPEGHALGQKLLTSFSANGVGSPQ